MGNGGHGAGWHWAAVLVWDGCQRGRGCQAGAGSSGGGALGTREGDKMAALGIGVQQPPGHGVGADALCVCVRGWGARAERGRENRGRKGKTGQSPAKAQREGWQLCPCCFGGVVALSRHQPKLGKRNTGGQRVGGGGGGWGGRMEDEERGGNVAESYERDLGAGECPALGRKDAHSKPRGPRAHWLCHAALCRAVSCRGVPVLLISAPERAFCI